MPYRGHTIDSHLGTVLVVTMSFKGNKCNLPKELIWERERECVQVTIQQWKKHPILKIEVKWDAIQISRQHYKPKPDTTDPE